MRTKSASSREIKIHTKGEIKKVSILESQKNISCIIGHKIRSLALKQKEYHIFVLHNAYFNRLKKFKAYAAICFQIVFLFLIGAILFNATLTIYLLRQAKGQIEIITNTEKIETAIKQMQYSEKELEKIQLIQEIKLFAEDSLGLKKTNNYTRIYNQHGKPILWMLTACDPFSFNEKKWKFPFLGSVSYKGFFNLALAEEEENELNQLGYDVDLGKVSAWSTLGILPDPILSQMLAKEVGDLSELIIHELTHATLYIASDVDFNENFASFVGKKGAELFLQSKYGTTSNELTDYLKSRANEDSLTNWALQSKFKLEELYSTFKNGIDKAENDHFKKQLLDTLQTQILKSNWYTPEIRMKLADRIKNSQNAFFMSYNRYDSQFDAIDNDFINSKLSLQGYIKSIAQAKG